MKEQESVRIFFDSHAEDYEAKHYGAKVYSFMSVRQTRILEMVDALNLPQGARVLDAGCGPGNLLESLAQRGLFVYGMDTSMAMLHRTESRLRTIGTGIPVNLQLGNIEKLPYKNGSFDIVCSAGVIEYLNQDTPMLLEMMRVLRPGGYIIISVTNFWSPANYLELFVEYFKKQEWIIRPLNAVLRRFGHGPVLARHFHVRRHRPASIRSVLKEVGFMLCDETYFYFLLWPRPLDKFLPGITAMVGKWLERFGRFWLGPIAEGYLILSSKPKHI